MRAAGDKTVNVGSAVGRRSLLRTGGAASAFALAGCLGSIGGGGGPTGPVKVGVLAPEPSANPIGASIANGARLAAEQLDADGGVLDEDVEVVVKDTQEDPSTGESMYQELTVGESVDFTTGVFTSEVLLNIMDNIAEQETIHLGTGAATPEASAMLREEYEQYKYWFRTGPVNSHYLGVSMVDFAEANFESMGWESIAVLAEDYVWTEPVTEVLSSRLGDVGVDVAVSERYASGTQDFSPIYDDLESAGVDGAFVVMAHTGTPAVVQWVQQQRPFGFGGIHVPMQLPSYFEATEGACQFAFTQNSATPTSEVTDRTVPFADAYNEQFGSYPVYTGYITFDAVKQYAAAAEEAGSRDPATLVDTLAGMEFPATTGTIRYHGSDAEYPHDVVYGDDGVRPLYHQWQSEDDRGVQRTFWPDEVSAGSYQSPPWV